MIIAGTQLLGQNDYSSVRTIHIPWMSRAKSQRSTSRHFGSTLGKNNREYKKDKKQVRIHESTVACDWAGAVMPEKKKKKKKK